MKRREFLGLLIASATSARPARAQCASGPRTIAVLMAGSEKSDENAPRVAAFNKVLSELGWRDGDNVRIEYRWSTGKNELFQQYARELVALSPDVILANSTTAISILKGLTSSIPVVFALDMDPVGLGHVKSLAHPSGNFTGFTFIDPELIGKWMALLKDVSPGLVEAGLLFDPSLMIVYQNFIREIQGALKPGDASLQPLPVRTTQEMEAAINRFAKAPGRALMIGPDPFNNVHLKQIADAAAKNRIPTISVYRSFAKEGGLMAYGPDTADVFRQSAAYVDRILKGEKPANLPVQQPNKYEFVVNLKVAKALGLTVPPTLVATTDDVIE